jgi:hypothetical protein
LPNKVLELGNVTGQEWLLDEEGLMWLKQLHKLLGHSAVKSAVEVATGDCCQIAQKLQVSH